MVDCIGLLNQCSVAGIRQHHQLGSGCVGDNLLRAPHRRKFVVLSRHNKERAVEDGEQLPRVVIVGLADIFNKETKVQGCQVLEVWDEVLSLIHI